MKLHRISLKDGTVLQKLIISQLPEFTGHIELLDQGLSSDSGPLCLAIDDERRFVLLISTVREEDEILVKALGQLSWIVRHRALLARLYAQRDVDLTNPPRVLLIAPSFSRALREAAAFVGLGIELHQYHALEINRETALLFDPVWVPEQKPIQPSVPVVAAAVESASPVELTDAERKFFQEAPFRDRPS